MISKIDVKLTHSKEYGVTDPKNVEFADLFIVTGVPASGIGHLQGQAESQFRFRDKILFVDLTKYGYMSKRRDTGAANKTEFLIDFGNVARGIYGEHSQQYHAIILFGRCDNMDEILKNFAFAAVINVSTSIKTIVNRLLNRLDLGIPMRGAIDVAHMLKGRTGSKRSRLKQCLGEMITKCGLHSDEVLQTNDVDILEEYIISNSPKLGAFVTKISSHAYRQELANKVRQSNLNREAQKRSAQDKGGK